MNTSQTMSLHDLSAYGSYFQAATARSLTLLREIEQTVLALRTTCSDLHSFEQTAKQLTNGLVDMKGVVDDKTVDSFEQAEDSLEKMHQAMRTMHGSAEHDPMLRDSDGVCDAFRKALDTLADLHATVESLHWAIMVHNASLDTSDAGPELSTESEIHEFLASL